MLNVDVSLAPAVPGQFSLASSGTAILGEGMSWEPQSGQWWWTDIESASLHTLREGEQTSRTYRLPDRLGSFVFCRSGCLILGLAKRIAVTQLSHAAILASSPNMNGGLQVQTLVAVDATEPRTRINDGRTDRAGNYVFGTLNESVEKRPIGSFYQYSSAFGLRRLALPAVAIANSICFSPDGGTMYFTDTVTRKIMQCDYEPQNAKVSNIRLFAETDLPHAYPDGSVIDRNGCLWNAQWGAGRVVQYDPSGKMLNVYSVPVKNPTCPVFGGEKMDTLMLSSSRLDMNPAELKAMPQAGAVFRLTLDQSLGLADALFNDDALDVPILK